jgi:cellulose 1,4-beta-cellobiosidase
MTLTLNNTGGDFNLTDLVIRYWFTADGQANFTGEIDYATLGGGADLKPSMCVAFGDQLGSQFADIGFTAGGTVGPTGIPDIQIRIHTQNYSPLDQANDFSYDAGAAAEPNPNLAIYLAGALVGGCEP